MELCLCVSYQITVLEGDSPANGNTGFCVLRQLLEKVMVLLVCFQRAGGRVWSGEVLLGGSGVLCLHKAVSAASPFPT